MRSINEILIDADNSIDILQLEELWQEIRDNRKKHPLVQYQFAAEFLNEKIEKLMSDNDDIIEIDIFLN